MLFTIIILITTVNKVRKTNIELKNKELKLLESEKTLTYLNEKILNEREKLFAILENIPAFISLQDTSFKFKFVNSNFINIFGQPDDKKCYELFHSSTRPCSSCGLHCNNTNNDKNVCEWTDKLGNTYVVFENSVVYLTDEKMILKVGINITDRKQMEIQLKESTQRLIELNATKDKFFSIIGHDLKNPFNTILGYSELLTKNFSKYDSDKVQRLIYSIKQSSSKAYELLENLLLWSRSQSGVIEYKPIESNLTNLIIETLMLLEPQASSKDIKILNLIEDNYYTVCDINMIKTVVRNLITNAIKFTKNFGSIEISASLVDDSFKFSIKDSGVGISSENIVKLFHIENKTNTLGTANETGTGLGLILCKEFIERHGGKIWVESEQGNGSTFFFTIPKILGITVIDDNYII